MNMNAGDSVIAQLAARIRHLEVIEPRITHQTVFSYAGAVVQANGALHLENELGAAQEILGVYLRVSAAPTDADLIVDVNMYDAAGAGATIFAAAADQPRILDGDLYGNSTTIGTTEWPVGYYLTVDIDQIGSTDPGTNLVVVISHRGL